MWGVPKSSAVSQQGLSCGGRPAGPNSAEPLKRWVQSCSSLGTSHPRHFSCREHVWMQELVQTEVDLSAMSRAAWRCPPDHDFLPNLNSGAGDMKGKPMPCSRMVSSLPCPALLRACLGNAVGARFPQVWILTEHGLGATVWD